MIPKIIHWCWFGHGKQSALVQRCVDSWKRFCPDYAIKMWTEDNFDVDTVRFTREAYAAKKWAFVSDYVRLYALYHEGGIYMDSDVEVIKPFDAFLSDHAFVGYEMREWVQTGLIGSEKKGSMVRDFLSGYEQRVFILPGGKLNMTANVEYLTAIIRAKGYVPNGERIQIPGYLKIYPKDYFCPKRHEDGKIVLTENTCTIHHFEGSWLDPKKKLAKWVGQHIHPMGEYYINYFLRSPDVIARDLKGALQRRIIK